MSVESAFFESSFLAYGKINHTEPSKQLYENIKKEIITEFKSSLEDSNEKGPIRFKVFTGCFRWHGEIYSLALRQLYIDLVQNGFICTRVEDVTKMLPGTFCFMEPGAFLYDRIRPCDFNEDVETIYFCIDCK